MRSRLPFPLILLTSLLLLFPAAPQQPKANNKPLPCDVTPLAFTPGELQDIYATYNREYWNGRLPKATIVWTALSKKFGETDGQNDADYGETDKADDGTFVIRLDVVKNKEANVARTTILHEMCHVKTWKDTCHVDGRAQDCRRWLTELHRIMLEGAFDDIV